MNVFQYVSLMKNQDSTVALVGVGLLALFLVVIIVKMFGGMRKGTMRKLVSTALTAVSAAISYIIATRMSNSIIGSINEKTVQGLVNTITTANPETGLAIQNVMSSLDPELLESVLLLPATLLLIPLATVVIFLLINLVFKIVGLIINKIAGFKKAKTNPQRLGGALLGAVEGIIWVLIVGLPFTGLLSLVGNAYDEGTDASSSNLTEIRELYEDYIEPFTLNPSYTFINSLGAERLADGIATVKIKGEKVNIREETVSIASVVISEAPKFKSINLSELSTKDKKTIDNIIDGLCDSTYASNILVCGLQSMSAMVDLGKFPIEVEGDFSDLSTALSGYLLSISLDTLHDDLDTVKNIYFALSDGGILTALKNGSDFFAELQSSQRAGNSVVDNILSILEKNPRTAALIKPLTKSLIASLATSIELEDGVTVSISYDSLKTSFDKIIKVDEDDYDSRDEYMDALKGNIDKEFSKQGVDVDDDVLESVAEYVDENFSEKNKISDEEFTDIMVHYYESYMDYLENGGSLEDLEDFE